MKRQYEVGRNAPGRKVAETPVDEPAFQHGPCDGANGDSDGPASQTVLFWYWMLGKDSIESNQFVLHIYTAASPALQRFIEQQFLSVTLSNGEPVIEVIPQSKLVMYFIIGIAVVVALLLSVVLALVIMYLKSMKKLSQVKALKSEMQLDTESPVVKVMRFLQVSHRAPRRFSLSLLNNGRCSTMVTQQQEA